MIHYVYILQSFKDASYYIGVTNDLKQRIAVHNTGGAKYSKSKIPYKLRWFCGFSNQKMAGAFERYLKSSSGFAFRNKHLV